MTGAIRLSLEPGEDPACASNCNSSFVTTTVAKKPSPMSSPYYSERYRNGEPIATGFAESSVNEVVSKRFCKKQQMAWSKEGAHLLLQTRVRTLNGELAGIFKRWYPDLDVKAEAIPIAA